MDINSKEDAGSADEGAKQDFVNKEDFDKLSSQFTKFTDVVTQHLVNGIRSPETGKAADAGKSTPPADSSDSIDLDDINLDKKALDYIEKRVDKIAEEKAKKIVAMTSASSNLSSLTQKLDSEAYSEFPDLKRPSSAFYIQTKKIMDEIRAADPSADSRPDFVLSSALRAKAILDKAAALQANNTAPVVQSKRFDKMSVEMGMPSSKFKQNSNQEKVSDSRLAMRKLLRGE